MPWQASSSIGSANIAASRRRNAAIAAFVPKRVGLAFAIDETPERRWGRKIRTRGHNRDPLAFGKERSVFTSGIRWIVLALVVSVPWASRPWALPILSLPCPTPKVSLKLGRRHKTISERARQMIASLRRWLSGVALTVVGDSAYSVTELGLACRRRDVGLIAPLRLDAWLFAPAPERVPGAVGRPRVAGDRLPKLDVVLADPKTALAKLGVRWYDGAALGLEVVSGTALWYHTGFEPLPMFGRRSFRLPRGHACRAARLRPRGGPRSAPGARGRCGSIGMGGKVGLRVAREDPERGDRSNRQLG